MRAFTTIFAYFVAVALYAVQCDLTADFNQVVPKPSTVQVKAGAPFVLKSGMTIGYEKGNAVLQGNAELLAQYVREAAGIELKVKAGKGHITLAVEPDEGNAEGYTLQVTKKGVRITGNSAAGNFYGCQTLRKSLPVQVVAKPVAVPQVLVSDQPRFDYRGCMLDCARHFFTVDFVKRYIDVLALHNINVMHWHLTDDQGWRVEVKSMPELAVKGSVRKQTMVQKNWSQFDGTPHTGYYTQDEMRDIVAYAAKRHITIIPEIDMPGHMIAALHVYPELGCTGGPYDVCQIWGVMPDVLCVGNPKTMEFIKKVLAEVCDIFPSKYIHVGGDECPRDRWKVCPKCQAFADKMGYTDHREARLQNYIMSEAEKFLNSRGREIIGWDEILEGEVAPGATIMSWRGFEGGVTAARMGHKVIMTPTSHCYIDYYQSKDTDKEPLAIGGYLPLEKVYSLEPVPAELSKEQQPLILGAQCNLWTEYISEPSHIEYMLLPRLAALSEVAWTAEKDYASFLRRMESLRKIYDVYKLNYKK